MYGLEIGGPFQEVRKDVVKASGKKQTPWEYPSHERSSFFL